MQSCKESRSFLQKLLQSPPALPFEPTLLPALFAVTQEDSTASTGDVVALIERSQKLTTRVLTLANSAAYGMEFKIASLPRAVSILGIREIRVMAVLVGMSAVIKEASLPSGFDIAALWQHQLTVAGIAKTLAAELGGPSGPWGGGAGQEDCLSMAPDEAYVAGLLHDIGKVFFASSRPDLWEAVEDARQKSGQHFFEAENDYWGMDHGLIGAEVLHQWKLPLLLTEPINWHHAPELALTYKTETRLLAAANRIAREGFDACGNPGEAEDSLLPEEFDAAALAAAITQSLAATGTEVLKTLVE